MVRRDFCTTLFDKYYKEYGILFNKVYYITDNGLIFESKNISRYLQFKIESPQYDFRDTSDLILGII